MDDNNKLNVKRGYLINNFELFHLKDQKNMEFEFHYHDFDKIIVFISGNVTYLIEGKAYKLKPWDLLFVSSSDVHKPIISPEEPYERIVLWINHSFLLKHNSENCNLLQCFNICSNKKVNLIRLNIEELKNIKYTLVLLENAISDTKFASNILKDSLFLELMVYFNRICLDIEDTNTIDVEFDKTIQEIINYINCNLEKDLSIEKIAAQFFLNKYYLMHKFKDQTGYTLHSFIRQKRLVKAALLLKKGSQITKVYCECGFNDYSSFMRAFKEMYGLPPKKYFKEHNGNTVK